MACVLRFSSSILLKVNSPKEAYLNLDIWGARFTAALHMRNYRGLFENVLS